MSSVSIKLDVCELLTIKWHTFHFVPAALWGPSLSGGELHLLLHGFDSLHLPEPHFQPHLHHRSFCILWENRRFKWLERSVQKLFDSLYSTLSWQSSLDELWTSTRSPFFSTWGGGSRSEETSSTWWCLQVWRWSKSCFDHQIYVLQWFLDFILFIYFLVQVCVGRWRSLWLFETPPPTPARWCSPPPCSSSSSLFGCLGVEPHPCCPGCTSGEYSSLKLDSSAF